MVQVTFTNGTDTVELAYVRNISWSSTASLNLFDKTTDPRNRLVKQITINGYINQSVFESNVAAQTQLENDLKQVSLGAIKYDGLGAAGIEDCRFTGLEFEEFRGDPISSYTISFITQADNIHAHSNVIIDTLTLSYANGFTDIAIQDNLGVQGDDEQIVSDKRRTFTISGSIVGETVSEINGNADKLQTELQSKDSVTLTLSSSSGGSTFDVRPKSIRINAPTKRSQDTPRTFSIELATYDDYTKEPYTLGEVQQTYGGITWDVVQTVDKQHTFNKSVQGVNKVTEESLTVTGKVYYDSWQSYDNDRNFWNPENGVAPFVDTLQAPTYSISSSTGATLTLRNVSLSAVERDGNFPITNAKRYSSSVSAQWAFVASETENSLSNGQVQYLGFTFDTVSSISPSVSLDEQGNEISRSVSVSGTLVCPESDKTVKINELLSLRGQSHPLTTGGASGDNDYFVTSVNVSSVDTEYAGAAYVRITFTINASQLNTANQSIFFISKTFNLGNFKSVTSIVGEQPLISHITSLSKSFNYASFNGEERVESISISCGGEVWQPDVGAGISNGAPVDSDVNIRLFNALDRTLHADFPSNSASGPLSGSSGSSQSTTANQVLPTSLAGESWTINSINIGPWEPFIKQTNPNAGERYWKQNISLSVKVMYNVTGLSGASGSDPIVVVTKSQSITDPSPKFVQLQVAGFGTVFKRIGTNPAKAIMTAESKYKDLKSFPEQADPPTPDLPPSPASQWGKLKDTTERRNLVIRRSVEYIQISEA